MLLRSHRLPLHISASTSLRVANQSIPRPCCGPQSWHTQQRGDGKSSVCSEVWSCCSLSTLFVSSQCSILERIFHHSLASSTFMPGKQSSFSSHWQSFFSGPRKLLRYLGEPASQDFSAPGRKLRSARSIIALFVLRAVILYAVLFWSWSYAVPAYIDVLIPFANKELQILGLSELTRFGPATDPSYHIGVYNRYAAGMEDALFNLNLESIRSHLPMVLALILAMPVAFRRRLKAAAIGVPLMLIIDSNACIVIMSWSYIFLADQHRFTPFSNWPLRDGVTNFLYYFYGGFGAEVVPIIVWALSSIRSQDLRKIGGSLQQQHTDQRKG